MNDHDVKSLMGFENKLKKLIRQNEILMRTGYVKINAAGDVICVECLSGDECDCHDWEDLCRQIKEKNK